MGILFKCVLIREPYSKKSDNWEDTAFAWRAWVNNESFKYFTGSGLVNPNGRPKPPTLDDVLYALVSDAEACDMSFDDWCSSFGYDTDSRKALDTYLACQRNATKLRKAGIDIDAERERLADY